MAVKTASGDQAAAIAAALARFEAEVGAVAGDAPETVSPWQRAALLEGVGAKQTIQDSKGGARWQS
ncbi:MAG: hypothetical protein H0X42_10695 [Solirubrobacterales bacterium]|nr:hypothetical protein [Solirubrobacterales bacterium]